MTRRSARPPSAVGFRQRLRRSASSTQRSARSTTRSPARRLRDNKRRRASAIDRLINWFLGRASKHSQAPKAPPVADQSDVKLVLIGNGSRMSGIKGTKRSVPWAVVRRRFAQRGRNEGFMALLNNEHCTSIKTGKDERPANRAGARA